ncbi:glycosyltransferase [Paenibacillus sp. UMB4589-SE434]|uniref:glycosyltransferase n=1 Tax=Paenibacillus sp. UMB4589-SE434 TaxID=3046314 RepID=UPI00254D7E92|nr:glycosyltransferase [Paenibacillus sp. UMB4589-SE434]MDK8179886.1 glycosyltransferase [Paenibacillus sp. UMB4589-SE434]
MYQANASNPVETRLSLCMIVKDEAALIGACLHSVKDVVDEIIIVDTGSTDDTVAICQSYGAHVYKLGWRNDFAEARNYSLQHATGDWILWMDADEQLDQDTASSLRDILAVQDSDIAVIELINYIGSEPANKDLAYLVRHHRLFRNHRGFQFKGAIHEQLNVQEVLGTNINVYILPVKIHHYGYMDVHVKNREKSERNMKLLEQEKLNEGYNPWIDYHLASEYYRLGQYEQAYAQVNVGIKGFIERGKLPPSLCYKLKYDALLANGSYEGGWPSIERAIQLYPDYVDLYLYKGIILFHKQKHELALEAFHQCLTLGEENLQHLTMRGVGSFHAWYHIGLCYEKLGRPKEAVHAYQQSLAGYSQHEKAREALSRLLQQEQEQAASIKISLCMIVRNEEESLQRCLDSVIGLVDEIIIVDTGSTDNTKQIATQNKAKVYEFEWIDDFGAARNYAFSKATQEYILWLDADDVIQQKDHAAFKELKQTLSRDIKSVTMAYVLNTNEAGEPLFSIRRNRLVRRDANFKWHGPVHEYLAVGGQIQHSDIAVYHKKDKQYTDRNLRIYENRLAAGEQFTPRDLYYYANELKDHARYEDALEFYEKFLQTKQGWVEDCIQACLKMETCHDKLNNESKRLTTLFRSFEFDKPHSDICCQIGEILLNDQRLHQAIYWFEQATQLVIPSDQLTMTQESTWTWVPHLKLCVSYDQIGQTEKACYHNEIALSYLPDHPSMLYNRDYFKQKLGDRFEFVTASSGREVL